MFVAAELSAVLECFVACGRTGGVPRGTPDQRNLPQHALQRARHRLLTHRQTIDQQQRKAAHVGSPATRSERREHLVHERAPVRELEPLQSVDPSTRHHEPTSRETRPGDALLAITRRADLPRSRAPHNLDPDEQPPQLERQRIKLILRRAEEHDKRHLGLRDRTIELPRRRTRITRTRLTRPDQPERRHHHPPTASDSAASAPHAPQRSQAPQPPTPTNSCIALSTNRKTGSKRTRASPQHNRPFPIRLEQSTPALHARSRNGRRGRRTAASYPRCRRSLGDTKLRDAPLETGS